MSQTTEDMQAENAQLKRDIEHERQQNGALRERVERQAAQIVALEPRLSALRSAMRKAITYTGDHDTQNSHLLDALEADSKAAAGPEETDDE